MEIRKNLILTFFLFIISATCFINSGYTVEITRNHMNMLNDPSGWGSIQFSSNGGTIVSSDSPDGGGMLQYRIPAGIADGSESARVWYSSSSNISEVYIQFYHKYSSDYTSHPIGEKILYLYSDGERESHGELGTLYGDTVFQVYGTNYDLIAYNTGNGRPIKGVWYKYNIHTIRNSSPGSHDGILQVWINDVLKINRRNIMYFGPGTTLTGWKDFDLSDSYGGEGGANPSTSYTYFDDFIISTTPISIDGNIKISTIPNSPKNLMIQ